MENDQLKADRRARLGQSSAPASSSHINQGYSVFVKILRVCLPLCALGIMAVLLTWPDEREAYKGQTETTETSDGFQVTRNKELEENIENELIAADFSSKTTSGTPYTLTAERAIQKKEQPDLIFLKKLDGVLENETAPILLKAKEGTYNQKTQFLTLNQEITIRQEGRGTMFFTSLDADLKQGEAMSPLPVRGESIDGTIEAESMKLEEQGKVIIFHGPAHLTMNKGMSSWGE